MNVQVSLAAAMLLVAALVGIGGVMAGFIEAVLRARGEWPYV